MTQKAVDYLGSELFKLYKEKHPTINDDTDATEISVDYAMYGFQIPIPQEIDIFDMSPTAAFKSIAVLPKSFETWALNKHGRFYKLAFVQELNCLYIVEIQK